MQHKFYYVIKDKNGTILQRTDEEYIAKEQTIKLRRKHGYCYYHKEKVT